jgi:hypothetical protein
MQPASSTQPIALDYPTIGISFDGVLSAFNGILSFFGLSQNTSSAGSSYDVFTTTLFNWWVVLSLASLAVSLALLYGIIYARLRINALNEKQMEILHADEEKFHSLYRAHESIQHQDIISEYASSENPNDWRQAIIQADIVLETLLDERGIPGTTVGERLKNVSPEKLKTLQDAWSAHKVRNEIAHKGGDFILTKRITTDTIAQYNRVFNELRHGNGAPEQQRH